MVVLDDGTVSDEEREKREIAAYWERYNALSFREKLQQEGITRWISNTNAGVAAGVVAALVLFALIAWIS